MAATGFVPVMDSASKMAKFALDWATTADEVELTLYLGYRVSSAVTGVAPRQARCNVTPGDRS